MSQFKTGDKVLYVLPKAQSRPNGLNLPATVVNVTKHRIVIRLDGSKNHRNVLEASLVLADSPQSSKSE